MYGDTLFTTRSARYRDTGFTEGVQYSLVNNVWGIHYSDHGDTLFTVTPEVSCIASVGLAPINFAWPYYCDDDCCCAYRS